MKTENEGIKVALTVGQIIGVNMRNARYKANLTSKIVASRVGMGNGSQLSLWERGVRPAPYEMMQKLAKLYGVTTRSLLSTDDGVVLARQPGRKGSMSMRDAIKAVLLDCHEGKTTPTIKSEVGKFTGADLRSIDSYLYRMTEKGELRKESDGGVPGLAVQRYWLVSPELAETQPEKKMAESGLGEVRQMLKNALAATDSRRARVYVQCAAALLEVSV